MLSLLGDIKAFVRSPVIITDSVIFWLHYRVTTIFLLVSSTVLSGTQYFGSPIHCMGTSDRELYSQVFIDTFCWTKSTYTLPDAYGKKAIYPGVGSSANNDGPAIYHSYYQWVSPMLCLQAFLFYIPHLLWKRLERKRLEGLMLDLNKELRIPKSKKSPVRPLPTGATGNNNNEKKNLLPDLETSSSSDDDDTKQQHNCRLLAKHLVHMEQGRNTMYVFCYYFCELLNLTNDIVQIYLVNSFLGGSFTAYGLQVLEFIRAEDEDRIDPMVYLFPRLTQCRFDKYGASGSRQDHDLLCLLPLNKVNEKIYVVLWFWLILLLVLSTFVMFYRVCLLLSPKARIWVLRLHHRLVNPKDLESVIVDNKSMGDWFLLHLLGKNIDPAWFKELISLMSEEMTKQSRVQAKHKADSREETNNFQQPNAV